MGCGFPNNFPTCRVFAKLLIISGKTKKSSDFSHSTPSQTSLRGSSFEPFEPLSMGPHQKKPAKIHKKRTFFLAKKR